MKKMSGSIGPPARRVTIWQTTAGEWWIESDDAKRWAYVSIRQVKKIKKNIGIA